MREFVAGNRIPAGSPVYLGSDGKVYPTVRNVITTEDIMRLWDDLRPDRAAERNVREWGLITGHSKENPV